MTQIGGTFKNWIGAIARYKALNLVRLHREEVNRASLEDRELVDLKAYNEDSLMLRMDIEDLLCKLSPEDKAIFMEIFYQGLSVQEVADKRDMSTDAIYQRVSRARTRMRKERANER